MRTKLSPAEQAERKFYSGLRSALRRLWMWYSPERKAALHAARGKLGTQCAECAKWFKQKDVAVDHVTPCGSLKGPADIPGFVERLRSPKLQVLCKDVCHAAKTLAERKQRKEARRKDGV